MRSKHCCEHFTHAANHESTRHANLEHGARRQGAPATIIDPPFNAILHFFALAALSVRSAVGRGSKERAAEEGASVAGYGSRSLR